MGRNEMPNRLVPCYDHNNKNAERVEAKIVGR